MLIFFLSYLYNQGFCFLFFLIQGRLDYDVERYFGTLPSLCWNGAAEQTFEGIGKYGDGKMAITKNAMNHLRVYINFNQIRSHCGKEKGTTFSVRTTPNNKDAEELRYFSDERDEVLDSCDSLAAGCAINTSNNL